MITSYASHKLTSVEVAWLVWHYDMAWTCRRQVWYHWRMATRRSLTAAERLVEARALLRSGEARRIRLAAGLSVERIAGDVGASASAIHRWERGERVPRGRAATDYVALLLRLRDRMEES